MALSFDIEFKTKIEHFLHFYWRPFAIVNEIHCHPFTAYRWEKRVPKLLLVFDDICSIIFCFFTRSSQGFDLRYFFSMESLDFDLLRNCFRSRCVS